MAKRFDETDSFISTVLNEANWTQANIKVKLTEESDKPAIENPDAPPTNEDDKETEDDKEEDDKKQEEGVEFGYDACPLCEASLDSDEVIFENIDNHFNSLVDLLQQVEAITESGDYDGDEVVIESNNVHTCPLCESEVQDDAVLMENMNEHFDVLLEMLDELNEEQVQEGYKTKKQKPTLKPMPKK